MVGTALSHYKIVDELGRGGMGIVYKAEDTKLDRTVAIKVLPASALSNEEDRARFYREAKAAAQLHHPHIASVFEIDEAIPAGESKEELRPFIAMEYIDGEPLDVRIQKAPLKIDEAVRLATQVAGALELAHEKNIVHRDIKSANVMLTAKGEAKVLDFGLAKTAQSTKLTRMGSTMGTVAYMSPEQARGEEVDNRTDLWSLGIMLYEMISGRVPFATEYEQAAVYSIMNEDPEPLTALRSGVPMDLEYIVNKLLSKEKKHRYQSATDLQADLSALSTTSRTRTTQISTLAASAATTSTTSSNKHFRLVLGAFGLIAASVAITWMVAGSGTLNNDSSEGLLRLSLPLPDEYPLSFFGGYQLGVETPSFAMSDDGSHLAYVSGSGEDAIIVTFNVETGQYRALEETQGASVPELSPDGTRIAYLAGGSLLTIPYDSGRPQQLTTVSDGQVTYWSDDNWIYWGDQQGNTLKRIRPDGASDPESVWDGARISRIDAGRVPGELLISNGWSHQVFTMGESGEVNQLPMVGASARLHGDGLIVSASFGNIQAGLIASAGTVQTIESRVFQSDVRTGSINDAAHIKLTDAGSLVYAAGDPAGLTRVVLRSLDGSLEELPFEPQFHGSMDATRDGKVIVFLAHDGSNRIMLYDLERGSTSIVVQEAGSANPILDEQGQTVTWGQNTRSEGGLILRKHLNTSAPPDTIIKSLYNIFPYDWTADGRFLVYSEDAVASNRLQVLDTITESTIIIEESSGQVWGGKFSPDESLLAYTRVEDRGSEVQVQPFPPNGNQWTPSSGVGEEPEWREDTNELIYRALDGWYSVSYTSSPVVFSRPTEMFSGPFVNIGGMEYRVIDNGRVLLQESVNKDRDANELVVITNWAQHVIQTLKGEN